MADTTVPSGSRTPRSASSRTPYAWIRRRARRLAKAYNLTRHEALKNALIDWTHFRPDTPITLSREVHRG